MCLARSLQFRSGTDCGSGTNSELPVRRALNRLGAEDTIALEARSPIGLSLLAI